MCSHLPHMITTSACIKFLLPHQPGDQVRSHNKNSLLTEVSPQHFRQSSGHLSMCPQQNHLSSSIAPLSDACPSGSFERQ